MLDLTRLVDMNTHTTNFSSVQDEYSLYRTAVVKPVKLHVNKNNIVIETDNGEKISTRYYCTEATLLISSAIEIQCEIKIYVTTRIRDGKIFAALDNNYG